MKILWPEKFEVKEKVPLASHSSWLVGGPAEYFAEPTDVENLSEIVKQASDNEVPVTIIGGGTNVLIGDAGIRGLVISLSKLVGIQEIQIEKYFSFWALAGTPKSEVLKIFLKQKLAAAQFLAGLPGQVGGGVVMNAGISENISPREFHQITEAIEVIRPNGRREIVESKKLQWGYRHCEGWRPGVISRVKISCPNEPRPDVLPQVKNLNQSRLKKQPLEWPSCGSVFRNPLPQTAGKLIEEAGLKGKIIGGAQISEKHANFIINRKEATARDIKSLMDLCVQCVKEKFNVELKSEVVFLGESL